jgi:hypothetical protein
MKPEYLVEIDEHGVSCHHQDGRIDVVRWDELRAVLIETSDRGPFETDVFWILVSERGECVIPQGATGDAELLARLQRLDGFDNLAVIEAVASTDNRRFVCWTAPV